jgi:MoxR-like ATPase
MSSETWRTVPPSFGPRDPPPFGPERDILGDSPVERMLARVRLRAQLRVLWLRTLWRRESELETRHVVSHAQVDAILEGWDTPEAEAAFHRGFPAASLGLEQLARVEAAMRADTSSRLTALAGLFTLTQAEFDLLQTCLAASLDPSLVSVFAYLQDVANRTYVTEELANRLFGHGREAVLDAASALRRWRLVIEEPIGAGEPLAITCDPLIRAWVLGGHHLDEALVGAARPHPAQTSLPRWPVERAAAQIEHVLATGAGARTLIRGTPGGGRHTFAACVAGKLGLRLLAVDSDAVEDDGWPRLFLHAQRQAFLDRCALAWSGERVFRLRWPRSVTPFPVQFVIAEPGQAPPPLSDAVEQAIDMPATLLAERETLWRTLVPETTVWPPEAVAGLAARYRLTVREIAGLARHRLAGPDDAATLVSEAARHRLGDLAQWMECPFQWDDLVLPESLHQALGDLVYEARARTAMWENPSARRLFPQGRGLFTLLAGPPGTGKTMAAQVVAAALGLDLFRISLSSVVSKYIGETSKNLQRIFARAEEMDAVLLFDEADALFSRRTDVKDAHDRFANTDTNHLLQAVEAYGGVALLATNRKSNIDPAFLRRIRYVLDFPKPGPAERRALWRRLMSELSGATVSEPLAGMLDRLADSVEATGAQIKYAVLTALFAARRDATPVGIGQLLRGLERELIKEGRALTERDRERLRSP